VDRAPVIGCCEAQGMAGQGAARRGDRGLARGNPRTGPRHWYGYP
jgi:hypothetical protein